MKTTKSLFYILLALFAINGMQAQHENHQQEKSVTNKKVLSPHTSAMDIINGAHIHIDYSSPRVRERIIFGGLVGYNTVWQAGAHKATWIETSKDLVIGDDTLPAGKYAFFVIPGKDKWQVMFNSRWDQHGKDEYNEAENVLVFNVIAETLEQNQEELVYEVEKKDSKEGFISLSWEKKRIIVPFKVTTD